MKKFFGHFGPWKDENNEKQQHSQQSNQHNQNSRHKPSVSNSMGSSKGSMKEAVTTDTVPQGSIIYQCWGSEGGVQGFRWYSQKQQADEDGDIAEEFLNEVLPDSSDSREFPRLEVKHGTKPVILNDLFVSRNGNVHHQRVEHAGRLLRA